jgi:hypothetical protein
MERKMNTKTATKIANAAYRAADCAYAAAVAANDAADAYVLARMVRAHYLGGDVLTIPQAEALAVVFGGV